MKSRSNKAFLFIKKYILGLSFLLLIFSYFAVTIYHSQNDFITSDELAHVGAAESYNYGLGLNWEHPPAEKFLNSVFIRLFMPDLEFNGPEKEGQNQFTRGSYLYFDSQYSPQFFLTVSRFSYILYNSILFLWVFLYAWVFKLISKGLSLTFLVITVFSTSFITHAHLITYDVGGSIAVFLTILSLLLLVFNFHKFTFFQRFLHSFVFSILFGLALTTKFSNLIVVPVLVFIILFAVIYSLFNKKYKLFFQAFGFCIMSAVIPFLMIGGFYQYGFYNKDYIFTKRPVLGETSQVYNLYADFNNYVKDTNPEIHEKLEPWWWYGEGVVATIARSSEIQEPFLYGEFRNVNFGEYVFNLFWFKENPVLYLFLLVALFSLVYYLIRFAREEILQPEFRKIFLKKNLWYVLYFSSSFAAFLIFYTVYSSNTALVIGYRHFYPGLIFIYGIAAFFVYKLIEKQKLAWLAYSLCLIYIIFGIAAVPQSLTYTNFLWTQDKYLLAGDSTINWAQDHGSAYKYLLDNNLINDQNKTKIASYIFNLFLAPDKIVRVEGGPNYPELGRQKAQYQFGVDQIPIQQTPWEYLIVDINFFQNAIKLSDKSPIAKQNYEYIKSLKPIFQKNDVIFVYKLK
jgi:hypothetical protein